MRITKPENRNSVRAWKAAARHLVELWAGGGRALRLEPNTNGAPNVFGGSPVNFVAGDGQRSGAASRRQPRYAQFVDKCSDYAGNRKLARHGHESNFWRDSFLSDEPVSSFG